MDTNLIEVFGQIVKESRDTGLDMVSQFKDDTKLPKLPDEEQAALIGLIKTLDENQFQQLQQGVKYCIELSLFKLVSSMEGGVGPYSFDLSIQDGSTKTQLIGEEIDNDLIHEYFDWIS